MLLRQKEEVTLPRNHALEQSNHPCHGRLTFFHDNVITFNVFKIAYVFPSSPWNFPSAPFVATPVQICRKHGFYRKNTKRIATKTVKVLDIFRTKTSSEEYKHPREMEYTKFPGNYIKIKHENFRSVLTTKQLTIEGQHICVYIALRMFARGDSEYDKFKLSTKSEKERDTITGAPDKPCGGLCRC